MSADACSPMRVTLLALTLSILSITGAAHAFCVADGPAGVLQCLTTAYASRDFDAFAQLLAPDFVFVSVGPVHSWDQDRDAELEVIQHLFASPLVEKIALSFDPGYDIVPGIEPGTWRLDDLHAVLTLRATREAGGVPEDLTVRVKMALDVRPVSSPAPHYEIFREEDEQPR